MVPKLKPERPPNPRRNFSPFVMPFGFRVKPGKIWKG